MSFTKTSFLSFLVSSAFLGKASAAQKVQFEISTPLDRADRLLSLLSREGYILTGTSESGYVSGNFGGATSGISEFSGAWSIALIASVAFAAFLILGFVVAARIAKKKNQEDIGYRDELLFKGAMDNLKLRISETDSAYQNKTHFNPTYGSSSHHQIIKGGYNNASEEGGKNSQQGINKW